MKILIISANPQLKIELHHALEELPYQSEFIAFQKYQNFDYTDKIDLIIFDIYQQSEFQIFVLLDFLSGGHFMDIPVLTILARKNIDLREKLLARPNTKYLLTPADRIDLISAIQQILLPKIRETFESNILNAAQDREDQNIPVRLLPLIQSYFPADKTFLFSLTEQNTLRLLSGVDKNIDAGNVTYTLAEFPNLSDYLRQLGAAHFDEVSADHPYKIFFNSVFNFSLKRFFVLKFSHRKNEPHFLLIARGKTGDFKFWEKEIIESLAEIFQRWHSDRHPREEESRGGDLRSMLNALNFGLISIDSRHVINFMNKSARELIGFQNDDIIGKKLGEVIGSDNFRLMFQAGEEVHSAYERPEIELRLNNGEKILVGFNLTQTRAEDGESSGYIISLKDITYSKEMQEEMKRLDRLASLGVMASGIAHEIRNPLAGIKAIAQTFQEELSIDDSKHEFVRRIVRQVNRLDDMLRTLFSYAKPPKPNRNYFQIESVLSEVLGILTQKTEQQEISIKKNAAEKLPDIFADSGQVQQILFNLILNSIEAMEKDGHIHIQIRPLADKLHYFKRKPFYEKIANNPYVLFHLKDDGKGMSRGELNQIFNPFFTTKSFGTGLGLSIVYQIVKENDGIIYYESEVGIGTDCFLILPTFDVREIKEN